MGSPEKIEGQLSSLDKSRKEPVALEEPVKSDLIKKGDMTTVVVDPLELRAISEALSLTFSDKDKADYVKYRNQPMPGAWSNFTGDLMYSANQIAKPMLGQDLSKEQQDAIYNVFNTLDIDRDTQDVQEPFNIPAAFEEVVKTISANPELAQHKHAQFIADMGLSPQDVGRFGRPISGFGEYDLEDPSAEITFSEPDGSSHWADNLLGTALGPFAPLGEKMQGLDYSEFASGIGQVVNATGIPNLFKWGSEDKAKGYMRDPIPEPETSSQKWGQTMGHIMTGGGV